MRAACASPCARRDEDVAPYQPAHPAPPSGRHGRIAATGTFVVGADVPGGPRPRNVPVRAWASPCAQRGRPPARGAPRTSRPTSRRIPAPRRGGTGAWRPWGVCGRGRRPRRPASPGTSPCTRHERPRARSMDVPVRVPLRAARRGRRALPADASRPPAGAARAHGGHGDICGRGRRPRRPASPGTSPCARHGRPPARGAPRTSRPTSRASRSPLS